MQSDTGNDELVEKVAKAIYEAWCKFHGVTDTSIPWEEIDTEERDACIFEARAALSVARPFIRAEALEEAAKVAESYEPRCDVCPSGVAAAIRALMEKP